MTDCILQSCRTSEVSITRSSSLLPCSFDYPNIAKSSPSKNKATMKRSKSIQRKFWPNRPHIGTNPSLIAYHLDFFFVNRIPKKWKWSGDMFISTGAESAEPCCRVILAEPTDPRRPDGLKFDFCFKAMDSMRITKLYRASHLSVVLPAFMPAQQLALVQGEDASETKKLEDLARYMAMQELVRFTCNFCHSILTYLTVWIRISVSERCPRGGTSTVPTQVVAKAKPTLFADAEPGRGKDENDDLAAHRCFTSMGPRSEECGRTPSSEPYGTTLGL